jgi:hypothetical protein
VFERELERIAGGTDGVMLGFGPGLTLEALRYRRGGRGMPAAASRRSDANPLPPST